MASLSSPWITTSENYCNGHLSTADKLEGQSVISTRHQCYSGSTQDEQQEVDVTRSHQFDKFIDYLGSFVIATEVGMYFFESDCAEDAQVYIVVMYVIPPRLADIHTCVSGCPQLFLRARPDHHKWHSILYRWLLLRRSQMVARLNQFYLDIRSLPGHTDRATPYSK